MERFEEHLDIRSFLAVYTNLALALKMLLNKEQMILFNHQYQRTIDLKSDKGHTSCDSASMKFSA